MSRWNYGCGTALTLYTPRGREYTAECGSTSVTGGVNQCRKCSAKRAMPEPYEDESDFEYDERVNGGDE
jgi:hypothetical protein